MSNYTCPITNEPFTDPVIASDGHTYERLAIEEWFKNHNTSPMTRSIINKNLIPNFIIKSELNSLRSPVIEETPIYNYDINYNIHQNESYCLINCVQNDEKVNEDNVVICVLDNSGSMGLDVSNNTNESDDGLTRLDLVKYSVKAVIESLNEKTIFGLVKFSTSAKTVFELNRMNTVNKLSALDKLNSIVPEGQTNIWDGIRISLELLKNPICINKNVSIVLLTDGIPNINPPRGIIDTLKIKLNTLESKISINTFGFGYDLESEILVEIAKLCNGSYAYIPDCSMVGTVFTNFISNVLSTSIFNMTINIKPNNNVKIISVNNSYYNSNNHITYTIGSMMDKRNILISYESTNEENDAIFDISISGANIEQFNETILKSNDMSDSQELINEIIKYKLINTIESYTNYDQIIEIFTDIIPSDNNISEDAKYDFIKSLLLDIMPNSDPNLGQIHKALANSEYYIKWGRHYLPSILRSHELEQCINFKDKSIQSYGSNFFKTKRDEVEIIYCNLPPPEPSNKKVPIHNTSVFGATSIPTPAPAPILMSRYMNNNSGCFSGNSKILIFDQESQENIYIDINNLQCSDIVITPSGHTSIKCIIKTVVNNPNIVSINGLEITPYHPIRIDGKWVFPNDISIAKCHTNIDYVYNLILSDYHIVTINDIEVVTLGHGFTDNDIIYHEYFGTSKVIEDLKKLPEYETGYITINKQQIIRNTYTNDIESINWITI